MKRLLLLFIILITATGCGNGYFFDSKATYRAVVSNLEVNLTSKGFVIDGDDLSMDGIVTGTITRHYYVGSLWTKRRTYSRPNRLN